VKYKDAVLLIKKDNLSGDDLFRRVADMFGIEGDGRIQLRMGKNSKPSANLVRGVVEEMKFWIAKVADGVGLPEESLKTLLDTEPEVMYSDWHVQDPQVTKIQKRVQRGLIRGETPIRNLRMGDIQALSSAAVGSMISEMREHTARRDAFAIIPEEEFKRIAGSPEYLKLLEAHDAFMIDPGEENSQNEFLCYEAVNELFFAAIKADAVKKKQLWLSGQITISSETEAEILVQKHYEYALKLAREHIPLFTQIIDAIQDLKEQGII